MRVLPTVVALYSVLTLPASVFATGSRQAPYQSLFTAQLNGSPAPRQPPAKVLQFMPPVATPPASAPTIVCGMTVISGDSSGDSAILHRVPAGAPKGLITVVPPPTCKR
jgi:hypothetical protein